MGGLHKILLLAVLVTLQSLTPGPSLGQEMPPNARPDILGKGWVCERGFRKVDNRCIKVEMPANAVLDYSGSNWTCARGFRKVDNRCDKVEMPANAVLDYSGSNWACARGFRKVDNRCVKVEMPANSVLDYSGSNWVCERGFQKADDKCIKLQLPQNATLDYTGNDWICSRGYKKVGAQCEAMTPEELRRLEQAEAEIRKRIAERQQRLGTGDDCRNEYRSNAEVCITVGRVRIDCSESFSSSYYSDCTVILNYEVNTNYTGRSSISADVECRLEISYAGRNTFSSRSDSSRKSETHTLYARSDLSESFRFYFSFSSFEEVTRVEVSRAKCEVDSVNLY